jgi:hypothetical protein
MGPLAWKCLAGKGPVDWQADVSPITRVNSAKWVIFFMIRQTANNVRSILYKSK